MDQGLYPSVERDHEETDRAVFCFDSVVSARTTSIRGVRAGDLRRRSEGMTTSRAYHLVKRLRAHGLLKKVAHTCEYYLTKLGRRTGVTALAVREYFIHPSLARVELLSLCCCVHADPGRTAGTRLAAPSLLMTKTLPRPHRAAYSTVSG